MIVCLMTLCLAADAPKPPPALKELSGLAAGRAHPEVLWAHNDSGNAAELFALDAAGRLIARVSVAATNTDWEDIASDARGLYLADTGDNARQRPSVRVYRFAEPDPARPPVTPVPPEQTWTLTYPDGAHDCEALCLHGDRAWLIEKGIGGGKVYRFDLAGPAAQTLVQAGSLAGIGPVLGADISADGAWLVISNPLGIAVLPLATTGPDADPQYTVFVNLGPDLQREAVAFTADGGVVSASESGGWWTVPAARWQAR